MWQPATPDWPEAYATLTVEADPGVTLSHDRQMVMLRREQRLDWLDSQAAEDKLCRPLRSEASA
jgi:putative SOS response-associated peptidase YedK